jgi:hypothetical protein
MMAKVEGYSPEGLKVTFEREVKHLQEAMAFASAVAQSGVTAVPLDGESRKEETIITVVRREHIDDNGRVTPVIDMYPAWKGDYGQFRFTGVYLNTDEDIAQFEAYSGLRLDSIPLYASQVPLQRKAVRAHPMETKCRPFIAHKRVTGEKEIDGVTQKVWKFTGYGEIAVPDARPALLPSGQMRPAANPSAQIDQGAPLNNRR